MRKLFLKMDFHKEFLFHSSFFLNSPNGEQFLHSLRIPERKKQSQNISEAEFRYLLNDFFYWKKLPNSYENKIKLIHLLDQLLPIHPQLIEDEYQKNKQFLRELPESLLQKFYSNNLNLTKQELVILIAVFEYSGNDDEELDCILLYLMRNHNINDLSKGVQLYIKNREIYVDQGFFDDLRILFSIKYNSFRILNWLNNNDQLDKQKNFKWACINGYLRSAQWLYNLGGIDIHVNNEKIFQEACGSGYLDMVQWLYNLGGIDIHVDNDNAFRLAYTNGHLNVSKWLYNLNVIDINFHNYWSFRCICQNGHLDVAQWLYSFNKIKIPINNNFLFLSVCKNGHLELAQWLYSLSNIDIHEDDDWTFKIVCEYGYLDVAQWLYSLGGVDIHAENDYAFRWVCINGHLELAQWLYSLGDIDIHANNNEIFRFSHSKIIPWLKSLSYYDFYKSKLKILFS